jgi:hypothetical protein
MTPHNIHAGKNDPRRLNEGAREHPVISSKDPEETKTLAILTRLRKIRKSNSLVRLRRMMQQISGLEG